jgi:hypothetical protein
MGMVEGGGRDHLVTVDDIVVLFKDGISNQRTNSNRRFGKEKPGADADGAIPDIVPVDTIQ